MEYISLIIIQIKETQWYKSIAIGNHSVGHGYIVCICDEYGGGLPILLDFTYAFHQVE